MPQKPEYDGAMKRWKQAMVATFGMALVGLVSVAAMAQIHAAPPSVTSMGAGGRLFNGAPPSVTSLGPRGYTPGFNPAFPNSHPHFGTNPGFTGHGPHHHPRPQGFIGYYGVPYYGYYDNGDYDTAPEPQATAVPTPAEDANASANYVAQAPAPETEPEPAPVESEAAVEPSAPTLLVFKDGHQLEVENYAIVGQTLFDLTPGHRRKVALADLDLTATEQQNDDRGIDFHVPGSSMAN